MAGDPNAWRRRPRAPQPGTVLGPVAEIGPGSAREFTFGGGKSKFSMFVVNKAGEYYAYLNLCPHYSSMLNVRDGEFLNPEGSLIRCSAHFAEFRIEDGFGVSGAAENCWLDPVPVEVVDGSLRIAQA